MHWLICLIAPMFPFYGLSIIRLRKRKRDALGVGGAVFYCEPTQVRIFACSE